MLGIAWKRWRWLDDGLLPLSAATTYAAWVYPVFALYMRDPSTGVQNGGFTYWLCLGTLLLAAVAGRVAGRSRRSGLIVIAGGLAAVVAFVLAIAYGAPRTETPWAENAALRRMLVLGSACAVLLWWRGVRLSNDDHHEETARTFVVGAVALFGLILVSHFYSSVRAARSATYITWLVLLLALFAFAVLLAMLTALGRLDGRKVASAWEAVLAGGVVLFSATLPSLPPPETQSGPVLLFIFSGLIARALIGLSWALNNQRGRGGVRLHVDPGWLVTMLGLAVTVVVLGLLIGQVLAPQAIQSALTWLRRIWMPIVLVFVFIFSILAWLVLQLVLFVFSRLSIRLPELPVPSPEDLEGIGERDLEIPTLVKQGANVVLVVAAILVVAWILYRTARQLRAPDGLSTDVSEDHRRIFSLRLLRRQLAEALRRMRDKGAPPLVRLVGSDRRRAVRRAYRTVLLRALALETPRHKAQTPEGYADTLVELCAGQEDALRTLTGAYGQARYGAVPPTHEQVQAAQDAYARIDAALRAAIRVRAREREQAGNSLKL